MGEGGLFRIAITTERKGQSKKYARTIILALAIYCKICFRAKFVVNSTYLMYVPSTANITRIGGIVTKYATHNDYLLKKQQRSRYLLDRQDPGGVYGIDNLTATPYKKNRRDLVTFRSNTVHYQNPNLIRTIRIQYAYTPLYT